MRGRGGAVKERFQETLLRWERTVIPSAVTVPILIAAIGKAKASQAEEKRSKFFRASL